MVVPGAPQSFATVGVTLIKSPEVVNGVVPVDLICIASQLPTAAKEVPTEKPTAAIPTINAKTIFLLNLPPNRMVFF